MSFILSVVSVVTFESIFKKYEHPVKTMRHFNINIRFYLVCKFVVRLLTCVWRLVLTEKLVLALIPIQVLMLRLG